MLHALEGLSTRDQLCMMKNLDDSSINFLKNCLSCIVHDHPLLRLCGSDRKQALHILKREEKNLRYLVHEKNGTRVRGMIKKQKGKGFIISSLIAAAIPLISSLIQKLIKK